MGHPGDRGPGEHLSLALTGDGLPPVQKPQPDEVVVRERVTGRKSHRAVALNDAGDREAVVREELLHVGDGGAMRHVLLEPSQRFAIAQTGQHILGLGIELLHVALQIRCQGQPGIWPGDAATLAHGCLAISSEGVDHAVLRADHDLPARDGG